MSGDYQLPPKRHCGAQQAETIRLNVGGKRFETTASTLSSMQFFDPLLEGRIPYAKDDQGYVFVDRSASLFELRGVHWGRCVSQALSVEHPPIYHTERGMPEAAAQEIILQALRTKQRPPETVLQKWGKDLLSECDYYGVEWLSHKICGETCPMDLLPGDRRIRADEADGATTLIDVHTVDTTPLSRESLQQPLLLTNTPQPQVKGDFPEFYKRLDNFSGGIIEACRHIPGLVIAGGSVIGAMTGRFFFATHQE